MNVNFIGRVGVDAETVTTGNSQFISCRVAESNGKESVTRWITVNADAVKFKNLVQYLKKGKLIYVHGTDHVSAYTSKSGDIGVDTRVWAERIDFIPGGTKQSDDNQTTNTQEEKNAQMSTGTVKRETPAPQVTTATPVVNDDADDLPF